MFVIRLNSSRFRPSWAPFLNEAGVCCLFDCGVSPGLSNFTLGRMEEHLDETTSFQAFVGGLPVERTWTWEYKAPF